MTPRERIALAAAMSQATGQTWLVSADRPMEATLCLDGVSRDVPSQVSVVRAGRSYLLVPDPRGWPYCRRIDIGLHAGRGWLPRLVAAAVAAVREYDAGRSFAALSARDARRVQTFRRLLDPASGASDSEREQAKGHLVRLGVAS